MALSRVLLSDLSKSVLAEREKERNIDHRHTHFPSAVEYFNHHDESYLRIDLSVGEVTWSHGIKTWLGYDDFAGALLPLDYLADHVHPFVRDFYRLYINAALLIFSEHTFDDAEVKPLEYRFVLYIPLEIANQGYKLVKVMLMPFDLDQDKKAFTFLQSFTLNETYHRFPMYPVFYQGPNKLPDKWMEDFRTKVMGCIKIDPYFQLKPLYLDTINRVRGLRTNDPTISVSKSATSLVGKKGGPAKRSAVSKRLKTVRAWLTDMMINDEHTRTEQDAIRSFFQADTDQYYAFDFFDFFEPSLIFDFLLGPMIPIG